MIRLARQAPAHQAGLNSLPEKKACQTGQNQRNEEPEQGGDQQPRPGRFGPVLLEHPEGAPGQEDGGFDVHGRQFRQGLTLQPRGCDESTAAATRRKLQEGIKTLAYNPRFRVHQQAPHHKGLIPCKFTRPFSRPMTSVASSARA